MGQHHDALASAGLLLFCVKLLSSSFNPQMLINELAGAIKCQKKPQIASDKFGKKIPSPGGTTVSVVVFALNCATNVYRLKQPAICLTLLESKFLSVRTSF